MASPPAGPPSARASKSGRRSTQSAWTGTSRMTETVLVTGGAGFIGSHLVERLAQRGDRVAVYDNFDDYYDRGTKQANIGPSLAMGNVRLVEADIRDREKLFQ